MREVQELKNRGAYSLPLEQPGYPPDVTFGVLLADPTYEEFDTMIATKEGHPADKLQCPPLVGVCTALKI